MIESCMFSCPVESKENGELACHCMRRALHILKERGFGTLAAQYIEPLSALLDEYEACLWTAVDFHGLYHLDDHYISSSRAAALLEGSLDDMELPETKDTNKLRGLLMKAAEFARESGRPCMVSRPGSYLGLSVGNEWEESVSSFLNDVHGELDK